MNKAIIPLPFWRKYVLKHYMQAKSLWRPPLSVCMDLVGLGELIILSYVFI